MQAIQMINNSNFNSNNNISYNSNYPILEKGINWIEL